MKMNEHRPSWDEYTAHVEGATLSAAIAIIEIDNWGQLRNDAARWTGYRDACQTEPKLEWEGWVRDVNELGRGWSSAQFRLFDLAAALATDRPIQITKTLSSFGNWEPDVWHVLVEWGAGGNNRDRPGRSTTQVVTPMPTFLPGRLGHLDEQTEATRPTHRSPESE